jgi:hypothetical protein
MMAQACPPSAPNMAAPFGTAGQTSRKVSGGTDEETINPTTRNKKFMSIPTYIRKQKPPSSQLLKVSRCQKLHKNKQQFSRKFFMEKAFQYQWK